MEKSLTAKSLTPAKFSLLTNVSTFAQQRWQEMDFKK